MNCESYFCHVPEENPSTPLPEPIGDLLKNTPLLEDYVDTAELSRFLQSSEIDTAKFMEVEKALVVAYWLRNSQVVSSNKVKLEALSY
jgi:asparagine synthase (glutamine-hydrolysing)